MRILLSPLLICLLLPLSTSANNLPSKNKVDDNKPVTAIPAFSATYTLLHKSDPVGTARRELAYIDNIVGSSAGSQSAIYHYETDIKWLIFSDKRAETSTLSLKDGKVTPHHYRYDREGTGRDKSYEWHYNLAEKTAKNLKKEKTVSLAVTDGLQDKLSYHLQNRLDLLNNPKQQRFTYSVINTSGSIKDYTYQYDGEEELILPYGLVKTIRLKREVIEKKRITYAWFAPELDYLLVKLYQVKAGAEQFEAQLLSINRDLPNKVNKPN